MEKPRPPFNIIFWQVVTYYIEIVSRFWIQNEVATLVGESVYWWVWRGRCAKWVPHSPITILEWRWLAKLLGCILVIDSLGHRQKNICLSYRADEKKPMIKIRISGNILGAFSLAQADSWHLAAKTMCLPRVLACPRASAYSIQPTHPIN